MKGRQSLIQKAWKEELHKYIAGIIRNDKQKLIAINSMPIHLNILMNNVWRKVNTKKTFRQEYIEELEKFAVRYDAKYLY